MILCLLFFCLLGESMALDNTTGATGNSISSKSIMCYYKGNMMDSSTELISLDPKEIPCECEIIIYSRFSINQLSVIDVDKTFLKLVTDLNKPVIVTLSREGFYTDWGIILGPDGNAKDAKVLCDFAKENKIAGYLLEGLTPECLYRPFNDKIAQYIIPYIKQLSECSCPGFIIGVAVDAHGSSIKNPCMYNFAAMNDFVTFYEIKTYLLNGCDPSIYNGITPITKFDHGAKYLYGMEEVASILKESKICLTKIVYDIEMYPVDPASETFTSYSQVCKGEFNCSSWCIQTTNNFFDKGKFALEQDSGIIVKFVDLDDIKNECACSSSFIGFKNIIAGFRGGSQITCAKYDVQSTPNSIK
ncbi:uncharacterized protein LOC100574284 isoform X1 [Acyrthosiphon pisum]|uniref:Uncharacterized protein n=2 Tax=Acyrthosiphon pisum TaxID=7029 RepID=A0A8R2AC56_ACYPI|nr:uncharacterized protein LOC100574284 isoform X1 [Acyrthosiphon pisum]|eukprot:XP_003246661.1 PREDICTED: uncharacterized protein LOC100574284 isoform X1 [Acyrthosiphon pisum]